MEAYEAVKLKSANKFLLFTLEKVGESGSKSTWDWKIVEASEKDGDNKERWEEMTGKLPEDEARFVVFDFQDTKADGRLVKKLVLIKWCVPALPLLTRRPGRPFHPRPAACRRGEAAGGGQPPLAAHARRLAAGLWRSAAPWAGGGAASTRLHNIAPCTPCCRLRRCPDTVHFRTKPIIGASYQTLKNKLDGIALDVEATDFDEIEYETIKVRCLARCTAPSTCTPPTRAASPPPLARRSCFEHVRTLHAA